MQSNRKIQRRCTRTKTVMINFKPQTELPSTPTVINGNEAVTVNTDTVRLIETEQNEVTTNEHITVTNTNNSHKIKINGRQFDFHKMRAFFEKPNEESKQTELAVVKVEQRVSSKERETFKKQNKEKPRKSESIVQGKEKNDKRNEKPKDHVNDHDKETGIDADNNTDKELRMFKFDYLLNLWKDRF